MKRQCCILDLQPGYIDVIKDIIWKRPYITAVYDKIVDHMAAKSFDCLMKNLLVSNVCTICYSFIFFIIWVKRINGHVFWFSYTTYRLRTVGMFKCSVGAVVLDQNHCIIEIVGMHSEWHSGPSWNIILAGVSSFSVIYCMV